MNPSNTSYEKQSSSAQHTCSYPMPSSAWTMGANEESHLVAGPSILLLTGQEKVLHEYRIPYTRDYCFHVC